MHASTSLDPLGNAEERHLRTLVLTSACHQAVILVHSILVDYFDK